MRTLVSAIILTVLVFCGETAWAGVILQQEENVSGSSTGWVARTVMIEGPREKIVNPRDAVVIDLDKGKTLMIHPLGKNYYELPFPVPSTLGGLLRSQISPPPLNYQKTGKQETVAKYSCDQYTGSGNLSGADYFVVACYSTQAPGAKEYAEFVRQAVAKLNSGQPASKSSSLPDGIPLEMQTKITMKIVPPAPSGSQAKPPVQQKVIERSRVVATRITSVKVQAISADEFQAPPGFAKRKAPFLGTAK